MKRDKNETRPEGWHWEQRGEDFTLWDHMRYGRRRVLTISAGVLPTLPDQRLIKATPKLLAALVWLVNDLTDAGEDKNPETGETYDSVSSARAAIVEAKGEQA